MTAPVRYDRAVRAIDVENAGDPERVTMDGVDRPLSDARGSIAVEWATRFAILPSETLLLAAQGHQVGRWRVPRSEYPSDRAGRDRWKRDRDRVQMRRLTRLLGGVGYGDRTVDRVVALIDERRRPGDSEGRHLGDAVSIAGLQVRLPGAVARGDDTGALRLASRVVGALSPVGVEELVDAEPVPAALLRKALSANRREVRPCDIVARANRLINRTLGVATSPVVTTSMQLGGLVLIDLIRRRHPAIPVVFVDTGYHFPETLTFLDRVVEKWGLRLVVARPEQSLQTHETANGTLFATDPVRCCAIRKVAPADTALAGHDAWFTALRREQAETRSAVSPVEPHRLASGASITKINPLAGWTWRDVEAYAAIHEVPRHPLYEEGYTSIGCAPCTKPTGANGDERSGRWNGRMVECGLHIDRSRIA